MKYKDIQKVILTMFLVISDWPNLQILKMPRPLVQSSLEKLTLPLSEEEPWGQLWLFGCHIDCKG